MKKRNSKRISKRNSKRISQREKPAGRQKESPAVPGRVLSLSRGYGFVRTEDGRDVFIPGKYLQGAFPGDGVLVEEIRADEKGFSGRIRSIREPSEESVTGTVEFTEYGPLLSPDNALRYFPTISELNGAKNGDKVSVLLRQDDRGDWNGAEVVKIFGNGESARVCADAILGRYGIPTAFPEGVLREAEAIARRKITEEELEGRLDLRNEPVFTIDGADAKDLDDAVSVKKTPEGFELGVHIADVSHYVKAGSLLDAEAMNRGTSVYFADRVVPMLPEAISNGVCSLNAGEDKLTFSALIRFGPDGQRTGYRFQKSVIRSKVRGVYSEVNELFSGSASRETEEKYSTVREGLEAARELALLLRKNAEARGTIDLETSEARFVLDENGVCTQVLPRTSGEAEQLIEELMIAANSAAARLSAEKGIPFLYRVHGAPEKEKAEELCRLLKALGVPCRELEREAPAPGDFAAVLQRVKNTPEESLISQQMLRTMEKAKYSPEPLGHFGLALADYSHFTSPIRRYPDTCIHRILTDLCGGSSPAQLTRRYAAFADQAALRSSLCEVRALNAERDAEDCYMAEYMRAHLGETFSGKVSGVVRNGVFVQLENSVEGFVDTSLFTKNRFVYDGKVTQRCVHTGRMLTIGTPVEVTAVSARVASGRVDLAPTAREIAGRA